MDFLDNLDDPYFNPFGTKSEIRNSPPPSLSPGLPPLKSAAKSKAPAKASEKVISRPHVKQSKVDAKDATDTLTHDDKKSGEIPDTTLDDKAPLKNSVKGPKRLVKKPDIQSRAPPKKKVVNTNKNSDSSANDTIKNCENISSDTKNDIEEQIIVPSRGYNLDFLDNLDDPCFNPFATKTPTCNSPPPPSDSLVDNCNNILVKPCKPSVVNTAESKVPAPIAAVTKADATDRENCSSSDPETISGYRCVPGEENSNRREESLLTSTPNNNNANQLNLVNEVDSTKCQSSPFINNEQTDKPDTQLSDTPVSTVTSLKRVPSFGGVSLLESVEFEQLLGSEASRLAEELTHLSFDANTSTINNINNSLEKVGITKDTTEDEFVDCTDHVDQDDNMSRNQSARRSLNLEGSNDPFRASSRINRSPPLGVRRPVSVGASADPFIPNRTLRLDDDSVSTALAVYSVTMCGVKDSEGGVNSGLWMA